MGVTQVGAFFLRSSSVTKPPRAASRVDDAPAERAAVEGADAMGRDLPQRARVVGVPEPVTRFRRVAVGQKGRGGRGVLLEEARLFGPLRGDDRRDRKAVAAYPIAGASAWASVRRP